MLAYRAQMHVATTSSSSGSQSPQRPSVYPSPVVYSRVNGAKLDEEELGAASSSITQSPKPELFANSPLRSDTDCTAHPDFSDQCSSSPVGVTVPEDEPCSSQSLELTVNNIQLRRLRRLAETNGSLVRKYGVHFAFLESGEKILMSRQPSLSSSKHLVYPPVPRSRRFMDQAEINSDSPMLVNLLAQNTSTPSRYVTPPMTVNRNGADGSQESALQQIARPPNNTHDMQESETSPKKVRKSKAKKPKEEVKQELTQPSITTAPPRPQTDFYPGQQEVHLGQRVPPHQMGMVQHNLVQHVQYRPCYTQYQQHGMPRPYPSQPGYQHVMWPHNGEQPTQLPQQAQPRPLQTASLQQPSSVQEMEFRRQQHLRLQLQQQQVYAQQMRTDPRSLEQQQQQHKYERMGGMGIYSTGTSPDDIRTCVKIEAKEMDNAEPSPVEQSESREQKTSHSKRNTTKSRNKLNDQRELDELHKAMTRNPDDPQTPPTVPVPEAQQLMIGNAIDCVVERVLGDKKEHSVNGLHDLPHDVPHFIGQAPTNHGLPNSAPHSNLILKTGQSIPTEPERRIPANGWDCMQDIYSTPVQNGGQGTEMHDIRVKQ